MIHVYQLPEGINAMMTHEEVSRSRNSLVVYVGLSSLGGHIDDDTNMTLIFVKFDLKLFKMKKNDVIRSWILDKPHSRQYPQR